MRITSQFLSIPPYISIAWKNVVSCQTKGNLSDRIVVIELSGGDKVFIPHLKEEEVSTLFKAHAKFLEESAKEIKASPLSLPFLFPSLEGFAALIEHDSEKKDYFPLPADLMDQLTPLLQSVLAENPSLLSPPEPDCHCPHCQVMNQVMNPCALADEAIELIPNEIVSQEDLQFRLWDIEEKSPQIYHVKNPSDPQEEYTVFLGPPLGCTCGCSKCEHLQAVLKT
ncbi:MAG: hypothetical protein QRY72_02715 [Candidatus Rhabdochlamydia sp.]